VVVAIVGNDSVPGVDRCSDVSRSVVPELPTG